MQVAKTLELQNVTVAYGDKIVLDTVNLSVAAGETVALLGASGSGKSTLLRVIAGLEPSRSGRVLIGGQDVTALPPQQRRVGFVLQTPHLFPYRSVGRNISYGLEHMRPKMVKAQRQARVQQLLELVQLSGFTDRKINTLSGGQAQRVALARALAPDPQLLLLDEPLSALDAQLRRQLAVQLREILREKTAVFVTHDTAEAELIADRVLCLEQL